MKKTPTKKNARKAPPPAPEPIACSFCGKDQEKCAKLVSTPDAAPQRAYICDECVGICFNIFFDDAAVAYRNAVEEQNQCIILLADRTVKSNSAKMRFQLAQARLDQFADQMVTNAKPRADEKSAGGNA